jgi:dTDP-4-dehydrorhamnose reductase
LDSHLAGVTHAIVVASITNYFECESNPLAKIINTELIPAFVGKLLQNNIHVNYISSNTVFGGELPWPSEKDTTHEPPSFAYANQKWTAERNIESIAKIAQKEHLLCITRLTKVIGASVQPFPAWYKDLSNGKTIRPFSDLTFAPITLDFAAHGIIRISTLTLSGKFHLSGESNINYADYSLEFASAFQFPRNLITPTTSKIAGIQIPFLPTYSGLGMKLTSELTGLRPQPTEEAVSHLTKELNGDL